MLKFKKSQKESLLDAELSDIFSNKTNLLQDNEVLEDSPSSGELSRPAPCRRSSVPANGETQDDDCKNGGVHLFSPIHCAEVTPNGTWNGMF